LNAAQQHALSDLRQRCPQVRLVLIGAAAIQVYFELHRFTSDVDLVLVLEAEALQPLMLGLGWQRSATMLHRYRHPNGTVADVLPASPALVARGVVAFGDNEELSLTGFDLALEHTQPVQLSGGTTIEVVALPVLVVLKIVAWLERPQERQKDLGDLAQILMYALEDDDERRWDAAHPVCASGLDHEDQSAFFIGYEVGLIAKPPHADAIARFLAQVSDTNAVTFAQMVRAAAYSGDDPEERQARLLRAFAQGERAGAQSIR
jgi:predicted nucleotidyltransferase